MTGNAVAAAAYQSDTLFIPERLRAYLLSYSAISDDPRVRRVGDLLHANGWEVVGIGLPGARSAPPAWPILTVELDQGPPPAAVPAVSVAAPSEEATEPPTEATATALDGAATVAAAKPSAEVIDPAGGSRPHTPAPRSLMGGIIRNSPLRPLIDRTYRVACAVLRQAITLARKGISLRNVIAWPLQVAQMIFNRLALLMRLPGAIERQKFWPGHPLVRKMHDLALAEERPGIWIANDWLMLPVAAAGAEASGGVYVYDSHEFAIEEYAQNAEWRRNRRPIAAAIEGKFIKDAKLVTSVSPDITAALRQLYQLRVATDTIRNAPAFQKQPFRATGERIRVLYHGVVAPGRGLEESIDSVVSWRDEFDLTIRGPESPAGYIDELRARIRERGLDRRVEIVPPVPMTQLVSAAAAFDIGLMALPGHSAHNRFALPNKIFEYMMAGLALCVSDLTSMRAVVAETGAGLTITEVTPQAIARAVNSFDRNKVDAYKLAALKAAQRYNWNEEGERLLGALENIAAAISRQ